MSVCTLAHGHPSRCSDTERQPLMLPRLLVLCCFRYDIGKVLGKGQFGTTRLCTDKKTGEQLAIKSISKRKLTTADDIADVQREVQIMHHLAGHQNVGAGSLLLAATLPLPGACRAQHTSASCQPASLPASRARAPAPLVPA